MRGSGERKINVAMQCEVSQITEGGQSLRTVSAYGLTGVGVNLSAAKSDFVDRLGYAIEMAGRGIVVVQDQKYSVVVLAATLAGYTAVRLMVDEKSGRAYEWGPWSEEYKSPQDEAARTFRINSGAGTIVYQSEPDLAIEAK